MNETADSHKFAASVIVPTRNRADFVARFLPLLAEQAVAAPYEVIIADNGSTDATPTVVQEAAQRWPHVRPVRETRPGGARARHAGALAAQSPLLIFVDDDMRVEPNLVAEHLRAQRESPGSVVLGRIVSAPSRHPFERMMAYIYDGPQQELATREPTGRDFWSGNVSIPRELYFRLGGYTEALASVRCGEDKEFSLRLSASGVPVRFAPQAISHHHFIERFGARLNRSHRIGVACAYLQERYPELEVGIPEPALGGWPPRAVELACRAAAAMLEPFDRAEGEPSKLLAFIYDLGLRTATSRGVNDYKAGRVRIEPAQRPPGAGENEGRKPPASVAPSDAAGVRQ